MRIYHYTSLDNLALILKNKTIRFNRLDQMDDPCERAFFSINSNWSPYTYVSCWTTEETENIPLWHMYAKGGVGIRIEIDMDCIDWNKHPKHSHRIIDLGKQPPINTNQSMVAKRYSPFSIYGDINAAKCYHTMNYIDSSTPDAEVIIGTNHILVNKELTESNFEEFIGLYKDQKWAFQNETRFRLFAIPKTLKEIASFDDFKSTIENKPYNPFTYIDLPLKETAIKNLVITLGPNSTESTCILAKLLIKEYAPSAKIKGSSINSSTWKYL